MTGFSPFLLFQLGGASPLHAFGPALSTSWDRRSVYWQYPSSAGKASFHQKQPVDWKYRCSKWSNLKSELYSKNNPLIDWNIIAEPSLFLCIIYRNISEEDTIGKPESSSTRYVKELIAYWRGESPVCVSRRNVDICYLYEAIRIERQSSTQFEMLHDANCILLLQERFLVNLQNGDGETEQDFGTLEKEAVPYAE